MHMGLRVCQKQCLRTQRSKDFKENKRITEQSKRELWLDAYCVDHKHHNQISIFFFIFVQNHFLTEKEIYCVQMENKLISRFFVGLYTF